MFNAERDDAKKSKSNKTIMTKVFPTNLPGNLKLFV